MKEKTTEEPLQKKMKCTVAYSMRELVDKCNELGITKDEYVDIIINDGAYYLLFCK